MSIRELAEQAGIDQYEFGHMYLTKSELDKFAELVSAHKREELLDIVYGYANHLRSDEAFQAAIKLR